MKVNSLAKNLTKIFSQHRLSIVKELKVMENGGILCEKNIYNMSFPENGDCLLQLKIEIPELGGCAPSLKRIKKFYAKRLGRIISYYKNAVKRCMRKKDFSGEGYPKTIEFTYELKERSQQCVSVLWKMRCICDDTEKTRYCAENWDLDTGFLISPPDGFLERRRIKVRLAKELAAKNEISGRKIRRCIDLSNFYFDGGKMYVFFQPGDILTADRGMISCAAAW